MTNIFIDIVIILKELNFISFIKHSLN